METLTSLDYAKLIQFAAVRNHMTLLNRTQINKILFYVYGVYLAKVGKPLFSDDSPKAWPYGPVFPIVNKKIDPEQVIDGFSQEKVNAYRANKMAMDIVVEAVNKLHNLSAYKLTEWSHQKGSPWYKTLFDEGEVESNKEVKWNTPIPIEYIKDYFKSAQVES